MTHCLRCNCELTTQTTHPKRIQECKRCVSTHAIAHRWVKQKEKREKTFQHEKQKLLKWGAFTMYDPCPGFSECQTPLAPGLYYKHDPSMCKRCHDRWHAAGEPMTCTKCKRVLEATAFYANAKQCKDCKKGYQKQYKQFRIQSGGSCLPSLRLNALTL